MGKQLRKEIYKNAFELSEKFPEKPSLETGLEEEIAYTKEMLLALEDGIAACGNEKIQGSATKQRPVHFMGIRIISAPLRGYALDRHQPECMGAIKYLIC